MLKLLKLFYNFAVTVHSVIILHHFSHRAILQIFWKKLSLSLHMLIQSFSWNSIKHPQLACCLHSLPVGVVTFPKWVQLLGCSPLLWTDKHMEKIWNIINAATVHLGILTWSVSHFEMWGLSRQAKVRQLSSHLYFCWTDLSEVHLWLCGSWFAIISAAAPEKLIAITQHLLLLPKLFRPWKY